MLYQYLSYDQNSRIFHLYNVNEDYQRIAAKFTFIYSEVD